MVRKLDARRNDSIPMSLNLVIAATALLVWTVESTRWPVKLA